MCSLSIESVSYLRNVFRIVLERGLAVYLGANCRNANCTTTETGWYYMFRGNAPYNSETALTSARKIPLRDVRIVQRASQDCTDRIPPFKNFDLT